jgi:uncharacterized integral membrane protein
VSKKTATVIVVFAVANAAAILADHLNEWLEVPFGVAAIISAMLVTALSFQIYFRRR